MTATGLLALLTAAAEGTREQQPGALAGPRAARPR
jgi:hypothetical protein